jgi:hypothetical protein
MEKNFHKFSNVKTSSIICFLVIGLLTIFAYQYINFYKLISSENLSHSTIFITKELQHINQSCNDRLTFERRTKCNHGIKEMCYSTNKSLVVTFWHKRSIDKWVSQNILTSFPLHSFDHMIFVHDDSSWHTHPGYKNFIWIHVDGQHRLWYIKRFVLPMISKSYEFLWIIDDDAQLNFSPLHYQCVVRNLNISLSAPARLSGVISHDITRMNNDFKNKTGRWTDFVETGPVVIMSSFAWQCIYTYVDASTGTGWGLDMIWCNIIVKKCLPLSEHKKACAILDAFSVDHQSTSVNSGGDGGPELRIYMEPYKALSAKLENIGPLAKDNKLIEFCQR